LYTAYDTVGLSQELLSQDTLLLADCLICRKAIASGKKIYEGKVNNPRKIVTLKNESDYVNNRH